MSGLCGWLGLKASSPEAVLNAMTGGLWADGTGAVASRTDPLAALAVETGHDGGVLHSDGSMRAAIVGQPYWSDPALSAMAKQVNNAAALLTGFRRHGTDVLRFVHGAFALAVVDTQAGDALLAIDRFGIHPLCYAQVGSGLVFGTRTDAVRAHPNVASTISPQAIFDYLNFSIVPAQHTIFREQSKLLPAQFVHFKNGTPKTSFYWAMPYRTDEPARPEALAEELLALLRQAVRRAAAGVDTNAIGAFLSGGLDSSTVAGLLAEVTQTPARSFTIGFDSERHDEMHYARAAVKHFKLTPYQHYLTPDEAVAVLPMMARLYDEPFGNSSAIPTYYCGKLARENGVGVLLAGDGGDELFAGNSRYGTQTVFEHYNRIPSILRKGLLEPIALALPDGMRFAPLRKLRNYVRYAMTPMPDRMLAYEHMSESEARSTFERAFLNGVDLAQPMAIARRAYTRPESQSMLQRMMHLDLEIALADNDLRKVTVMTRAAGIRVRFPFLDEDLAAFSARVPPPLLMKGSALRSFYKFALKDFLPPDVLAKKKHGFGMPYDLWLRTNPRMKEIICDSLTRFKRRGYCVGKYLDDLVASHDKDDSRSAGRAWDIMTLELWLQARGLS